MAVRRRGDDTGEHTCVRLPVIRPYASGSDRAEESARAVPCVMAEPRRVRATASPGSVPSSSGPPAAAPGTPSSAAPGGETRSDRPADADTVRLVLALFEPDERSFPEFSYTQLADNKVRTHFTRFILNLIPSWMKLKTQHPAPI